MIEFGHVSFCLPFQGAALAREDEELGFDIRYFGENSCFASDPFAELRAAAAATTRIKLATGATNMVTRHPSVVATSIAAVQIASGGRAICGVGKGDSAVGVLGLEPQRHALFVENARLLRAYLRGESVQLDDFESRLQWLDGFEYQPVPLELMASGPRAIRAAATLADRVTLAVGTAPERIAWALERVDEGLEEAGRTRADIRIGAYVPIALDNDERRALDWLRIRVKSAAHMASLAGANLAEQPERLRAVTKRLRDGYDYRHHNNEAGNPLAELVDDDFARWFGIGGPAGYVVERLGLLVEAGLSYFFFGAIPLEERERLAEQVLPAVRAAVPAHERRQTERFGA
jgi:5,10-methylenetetrahydromethanopterin reductase